MQKFPRIKVYNALAVPVTLYGREIWTLRKSIKKRLTLFEINFSEKPF